MALAVGPPMSAVADLASTHELLTSTVVHPSLHARGKVAAKPPGALRPTPAAAFGPPQVATATDNGYPQPSCIVFSIGP